MPDWLIPTLLTLLLASIGAKIFIQKYRNKLRVISTLLRFAGDFLDRGAEYCGDGKIDRTEWDSLKNMLIEVKKRLEPYMKEVK